MISIDKLQLFAGKPIPLNDLCLIYQPTLQDIADVGNDTFDHYLLTLTMGDQTNKEGEILPAFILLYGLACQNTEDKKVILNALAFFIREEITLLPGMDCFLIGDAKDQRFLTQKTFAELQEILLIMHHMQEVPVNKPGDAHAQAIREKINRGQKKVAEIKRQQSQDNVIDLPTILSSFLAKNPTISYKDLWDLPYYAFYEQFIRMQYIEEYETNMRSVLAGAKIPKSSLKHWIRKTDKLGGN